MSGLSRREFLLSSLASGAGLARAEEARARINVHQQLLDLAAKYHKERAARFAQVRTKDQLAALQKELRRSFLDLLDGLPERSGPVPPARKIGTLAGDDYEIEKLVYESMPGYFVSALVYRPKKLDGPAPGILSPCGHSAVGKAADTYQILHINLAKRGFVVLTYDPVGQGERSQFSDAERGRSRFNLTCGEHCVLGNPLYLLGTSLARYRIWDGIRGIDYLCSRPEVDAKKIGCIGNSGGGTLTSYIAALDERVQVPAIGCYITTLPHRMGNRIQEDPDSDPEQDIFGFVQKGIDHAGLLALMTPRPTILLTARLDFFPIAGARESFAEAAKLYEAAGSPGRIEKVEADTRHGLGPVLRRGAYAWFERWLHGRDGASAEEIAVQPRPARELQVCPEGQVNLSFKSHHLLPLALAEFKAQPRRPRAALKDLLHLDPDLADFDLTFPAPLARAEQILVVCLNGIEAPDWRQEKAFLDALGKAGLAVAVVDPRGVGKLRPDLQVKGRDYGDPLAGVEENLAYNAFLVGKTLVGMRVTDVLAAMKEATSRNKPRQIVLCGRRDAALVACLAAAVEPAIHRVAVEEMRTSFLPLFDAQGLAINAAILLPGMLRNFGDIPEVLTQIGLDRILATGFSQEPQKLLAWLR